MGFCVKKKEQKPVSFQKDKKNGLKKTKHPGGKKRVFLNPESFNIFLLFSSERTI